MIFPARNLRQPNTFFFLETRFREIKLSLLQWTLQNLTSWNYNFILPDIEIKYHSIVRILFRLKTGTNPFQNNLYGNEISYQYHVNKWRGVNVGAMNSIWNVSHRQMIEISQHMFDIVDEISLMCILGLLVKLIYQNQGTKTIWRAKRNYRKYACVLGPVSRRVRKVIS